MSCIGTVSASYEIEYGVAHARSSGKFEGSEGRSAQPPGFFYVAETCPDWSHFLLVASPTEICFSRKEDETCQPFDTGPATSIHIVGKDTLKCGARRLHRLAVVSRTRRLARCGCDLKSTPWVARCAWID
jgi:hypothetical protein